MFSKVKNFKNIFIIININMHFCEVCNYYTFTSTNIKIHYNSKKHIKNTIMNEDSNIMNDDSNGTEYVYCFSNPSYQDLLKIGWTRNYPTIRASSLFKTCVPTPFKIEFIISTKDGSGLESKVHKHLNEYRLSDNREFFKITIDKLKKILINELNLKLIYDISYKDDKEIIDLIGVNCKKEYKYVTSLKKHQMTCNNNETNSLVNDKINEVKKDYEYKLEIEKLKLELELKLKNEQLKTEKLKNEYEQKLEIERLRSDYELKLKNQECETLKITNTNSNNNNKITNNNITNNINISTLDFLNTNFCNVLNIDDFIDNYKNKYCLTKEETQILLDNSSIGGLDNCITTLACYLQRIAHKMYTDLKESNLTVKEAIMPILLVDGSARSHYEKNDTKWIRTQSMDKIKAIYNITNDQIFNHHKTHLNHNGYQKKKIQTGILKMCDYARLNDLKNDFYKKKSITNQDSSSNTQEITNNDTNNQEINYEEEESEYGYDDSDDTDSYENEDEDEDENED